jgi:DNA-binding NarL/FixJ family response regulator
MRVCRADGTNVKFLVVDSQSSVRETLIAMLRRSFAPAIVIVAGNADEAIRALARHDDLDLAVLNLDLPGLAGPQLIANLIGRRESLPIVVLSASDDPADVRQALALGAQGYVPNSEGSRTFAAIVHLVLEGGAYVPPFVLTASQHLPDRRSRRKKLQPKQWAQKLAGLTPRQSEILGHLGQDQGNAAIARSLNLSEKTVKAHVTAIFRALNVDNRKQAANVARAAKLI